jgi:hypothetical protein
VPTAIALGPEPRKKYAPITLRITQNTRLVVGVACNYARISGGFAVPQQGRSRLLAAHVRAKIGPFLTKCKKTSFFSLFFAPK